MNEWKRDKGSLEFPYLYSKGKGFLINASFKLGDKLIHVSGINVF